MTPRRPIKIAPCPRPGCDKATGVFRGGLFKGFRVQCVCGWTGPVCRTEKEAILAWNPRSDAEAERRGAMAAVEWLQRLGYHMAAGELLRDTKAVLSTKAIERGEVLPAKPEPLIVSRPGVMGGKPCVRGTRIAVETIQAVANEWPSVRILEEYPGLTAEGLAAALAYKLPGKKGVNRT